MNRSSRHAGRTVGLLSLGLLLVSLLPLAAATAPKPAGPAPEKERLRYERAPFVVERSSTVTSKDVGLPFVAGATQTGGSLYRLTDEKNTVLSYYAVARLSSPNAPDKVAQEYSRQMPGHPKPELVKDKGGPRWVLAIGSGKETRTVTIRPAKTGSAIELTRVTKPIEPTQPPESEVAPERPNAPRTPQTPNAPPRRRGPRGPRTPGGMQA